MRSRLLAVVMALVMGAAVSVATPQTALGQSVDQLRISKKISSEILKMPYYGVFDAIGYDIQGSTVILEGKVTRPTLKSSAEKRVRKIEGVEQVVNNIEVLPVSSFDDRIRFRILRNMQRSGSLYRYFVGSADGIRIIVDGGHVTLAGTVSNKLDAILARNAALQTPGVFNVTNNLRVKGEG